MDFIEEMIDFLIGASEQTRRHVDAVLKEAITCSVKVSIQIYIHVKDKIWGQKPYVLQLYLPCFIFTFHLFLPCKIESDQLVIGILNNFHNNKKIKTISDTGELIEHAVYAAAVEENSVILQTILRWNQNHKTKKFTHKGKGGVGGPGGAGACAITSCCCRPHLFVCLNLYIYFLINFGGI